MSQTTKRGSYSFRNLFAHSETTIALVILACALVFVSMFPNFATPGSAQVIFIVAATITIVGIGQTMLLICGELDLSVGTVFALAPFLMNSAYQLGVPLVVSFLISLMLVAAVGFANGYITAKVGVPSLITTLGMFFLIRGVTLIVSNFHLITAPSEEPFGYLVGSGVVLGVLPIPMIWALGTVVVIGLMLARTRHGLWTIAAGSNLTGAGEVGVNVVRTKIGNFVLAAILAGLAGIIQTMRIGSVEPLQGGFSLTLESVAAAAIGGTSLFGGSGTIVGTLLGSFLFGIFRDGLIIAGASAVVYKMILGTAVVLAVAVNTWLLGRRGRSGMRG